MKHLLCLCLLLLALKSTGQTPAKGTNAILIHTTDSMAVVYGKLGRVLLADGLAIEKSDKELGYINTTAHKIGRSPFETTFRFNVTPAPGGALITLQGGIRNSLVGALRPPAYAPIENRSGLGSPSVAGWMEMMRVSRLYPGGTLSYTRKP